MLFVIVQYALITDIYLYILDIENDTEIWYYINTNIEKKGLT